MWGKRIYLKETQLQFKTLSHWSTTNKAWESSSSVVGTPLFPMTRHSRPVWSQSRGFIPSSPETQTSKPNSVLASSFWMTSKSLLLNTEQNSRFCFMYFSFSLQHLGKRHHALYNQLFRPKSKHCNRVVWNIDSEARLYGFKSYPCSSSPVQKYYMHCKVIMVPTG